MKKYIEQRNALVIEMTEILNKAKAETRAFDETETERFEAIKKEIAGIDAVLKAEQESRSFEKMEEKTDKKDDVEVRAFENYIRNRVEQRADVNLTASDNGAIIPSTIANRIIETVKELSPIFQMATKYSVKGELIFPVYDETTSTITCAYATEFTNLESTAAEFTSVSLNGFLAGALTKVSRSLMNNSQFDIVSYVVTKMAKAIADFMEKELIVGTADKMTGVLSSTNGITSAAATAITADELIDLQMTLPEVYQPGAVWLMHKSTFKAIRKLKDNDGQYLLNKDVTNAFGWSLLGKPVYVTETMPTIEASAKTIVYGDMTGLYVNVRENVSIEILREAYAAQHVVGVIGWVEADSKIIEPQKFAILTMKAA